MGLFGGSTTTKTSEKFNTGPSSFQLPYVQQSFGAATDAFNKQKGTPYYQGDTYAGMSPDAKSALDAMRGFAGGAGLGAANTLTNIGSGLAEYAGQSGQYLDRFAQLADEDATTANMAAAGRYADNPYIQGQIDANSRDVTRNLTEDILPGIDRAASAGGNINSSRAGIASGIAQRGAADRISDVSASIRGDAWNRGLTLAQSDRQNKLNSYREAADGYLGLGRAGMDALRSGAETGYGAFDRVNAAGLLDQSDRQGYLDQSFQKWKGQDERDWNIVDRYNSIVGSNQWGQSGTSSGKSKSKNSGSILGSIIGAASTAASFSDTRLKRAVQKVGEFADGLGVYLWTYIWEPDDVRHLGVMAQEVAEVRPHALGPTIDGFMTVNYGKL